MKGYVSLEKFNTYKIKSFAKHVFFPQNDNEINNIAQKFKKVTLLGNGSNIIFSKPYYENRSFIILADNFANINVKGNIIEAQSGVLLKDLSLLALNCSLSGLETFYDIPASVGGAVIMNAGAYGDEIYNSVESVKILDLSTKKIKIFPKEEIDYNYRYSIFKNNPNLCVLGAKFKLEDKEQKEIRKKLDYIYAMRLKSLPKDPSGGSVFKRPPANISVGEMVQTLGLKGKSIGGAQISTKHGGFIINNDNATGQDILDLIEFIKVEIFKEYNVKLEQEQIVI